MRAKKSYGQHFLINESLAQSIVSKALEYSEELPILELGPGKAALTKHLLASGHPFKAVEADYEMVDYLYSTLNLQAEQIIPLDFLKLDLSNIFEGHAFFLLGNFPYNISSQILIKVLKNVLYVPFVMGMFQREVAERIASPCGNKSYGILSVLTQAYYKTKIVFKVSPGSFSPPPRVNSAVVLLERFQTSLPCNKSLFSGIVKTAFNQRRKMMRNSLSGIIRNPELLKNEIFKNRPEQLSVKEFIELTNWIENQQNNESSK